MIIGIRYWIGYNLKIIQMYDQVFGLDSTSLISEFDREQSTYFQQFTTELGQAPIDKPYEFCNFIKNSNGDEKKVMDFKTGIPHLIQEPLHWRLSSKEELLWLQIHEQPWAISSHPKL